MSGPGPRGFSLSITPTSDRCSVGHTRLEIVGVILSQVTLFQNSTTNSLRTNLFIRAQRTQAGFSTPLLPDESIDPADGQRTVTVPRPPAIPSAFNVQPPPLHCWSPRPRLSGSHPLLRDRQPWIPLRPAFHSPQQTDTMQSHIPGLSCGRNRLPFRPSSLVHRPRSWTEGGLLQLPVGMGDYSFFSVNTCEMDVSGANHEETCQF